VSRAGTGGRTFTEGACLVIGTDGMRSTVAQLVAAPYSVRDPLLTCAYHMYWHDVPADGVELYERPGGWVAAVRTNDGATLVQAYFPQSRFEEIRTDARRAHEEQIRTTAPALSERLRGCAPVARLHGSGDQQNFFRQTTGPGWVLVGDAGHHKDSITARGISDAFQQAESLVGETGNGLGGDPARLDAALARFAEDRDVTLTPGYRAALWTCRTYVGLHAAWTLPPGQEELQQGQVVLRATNKDVSGILPTERTGVLLPIQQFADGPHSVQRSVAAPGSTALAALTMYRLPRGVLGTVGRARRDADLAGVAERMDGDPALHRPIGEAVGRWGQLVPQAASPAVWRTGGVRGRAPDG
jgi:hypothetical protein